MRAAGRAAFVPEPIRAPAERQRSSRRGYIALRGAYYAELHAAEALGWPTHRLDLDHLAIVTAPDRVAAALIAIADRLQRP